MIYFVTSFNAEGYNKYAKNMLLSVDENWKDDLHLVAYYHDFPEDLIKDLPVSKTISYRNLNDVKEMLAYRERMKQFDGTMDGKTEYNWRMDAIKWCHKVYALTDFTLFNYPDETVDWVFWIDADTLTTKPFSKEKLFNFVENKAEVVHLGRKDVDYSETSFMGFNLKSETVPYLIADLRGCYDIGEVVAYREWHDGFIFERLLKIYTAHGMKVQNLTPNVTGLAAFAHSPLSDYMKHFKGNLKNTNLSETKVAPDVNLPRYRKLADLVRLYAKDSILEVGTWNGGRAIEMALAAFEKSDKVHYAGYDLFEDANEELDKIELNSKKHNMMQAVFTRLSDFAAKMKSEHGKTFTFELYKGDSKVMLTDSPMETRNVSFAYIDGGHSEATVRSDYEALKHVPCVVFDDYFSPDEHGKIPQEEYLGTNRLTKELKEEGKRIYIIPSTDRVNGGGITHIVALLNDPALPDLPDNFRKAPIIVRPRDSMPKEYIINNINENLNIIKRWGMVRNCTVHDKHAIIVSAGPSVDWNELKATIRKTGGPVVCVKHSYPKLLENGIVPQYCVILDPRPITGTSTHGIVRTELFKKIDRHTKFFVASMTDLSVTKYLLDQTKEVYGWHAYSEAVQNGVKEGIVNLPEDTTYVTGGTCSAMRAIGLFHVFGFRTFHLFGFDGCLPLVTEEMKKETTDGKPKYLEVETNGKKFWTTGELLAMAQDCEKLFNSNNVDMRVEFHTPHDTLISEVYNVSRFNKKISYLDYFMNTDFKTVDGTCEPCENYTSEESFFHGIYDKDKN